MEFSKDYVCENQMSLLDLFQSGDKEKIFKIDKPVRLIELFGGVGSQAMSLQRLGVDFEHYKLCEWEVSAIASYKAIHCPDDDTDYSNGLSKDELVDALIGISTDGKKPMTRQQIERKGDQWLRTTYNNIKATNNIVDITSAKVNQLGIVDKDKYCYIVCYSFPCQDLSVAGKQAGMQKGSNTRSGLLWEVERLLNETQELPQVLLMENVPQVHGKKNMEDFEKWLSFLENKGYTNFWKDMNAKNFGVAQNRNRCFCVSILGNYTYEFPKEIELQKVMKDYLEDEVDKKYYITSEKAQKLIDKLILDGKIITDRQTDRQTD